MRATRPAIASASEPKRTAAAALLIRLARQGVENLFGNAGTDFPSIIEAYAEAAAQGLEVPRPVTVPHENLAVAMAHGAYLASGRPQAVMVHVSVGTANTICGLLNAARENVPIILLAGRTPIMESGPVGSRNAFIHWGQEMFDQAAMVREAVKWDYELRRPDQVEAVISRAVSIAMTHPRGPAYVSLPREVLADSADSDAAALAPAEPLAPTLAAPFVLDQAADLLRAARRPLLVTASLGRAPREVNALARFAQAWSVPVVPYRARYLALPASHDALVGYEVGPHLADADLIFVAECDVPWIPAHHAVNSDAKVVHLGFDPLFARYPIRSFRADLALAGDPTETLRALAARAGVEDAASAERQRRLAAKRKAFAAQVAATSDSCRGKANAAWVARSLAEALRPGDAVVAESAFPLALLGLEQSGTYFAPPSAGGLGWGLGAALGLKMSRPDRRVVAVVGDGSYMFGNPTPAHYVGAAGDWPMLTLILNNGMWAGVRRATLALYPDGAAAKSNNPAFTNLQPSPRYEKVVEASGGYGEQVSDPADLPGALARALHAIDVERRSAVLNIAIAYSDDEARADAKR